MGPGYDVEIGTVLVRKGSSKRVVSGKGGLDSTRVGVGEYFLGVG